MRWRAKMPNETWEPIPYEDLTAEQRAPYRPPVYPPAMVEHVAKWMERYAEKACRDRLHHDKDAKDA